jgi:membrane protein
LVDAIHRDSGILAILTFVGLLWGGTNLFGSIENAFAFIYRVKTRDLPQQKLMAMVLILLFVVLLPLSFVSSLVLAAATTTLGRIMPGALTGPFSTVLGLFTGLFSLFLLFLAIYTIVPNMPVAWRDAWRGAMVAAVLLWFVNTAFPFYAAHFIGTRQYGAATIGAVIITITWVWFFALVLLIGAQINALGMGIAPWKFDITRILMQCEGPLYVNRRRRLPRHAHTALPFSGVAHDSYKVRLTKEAGDTYPRDIPGQG